MQKVHITLNVYFDNGLWVGFFECIDNNKLSVNKVVFGAEPKMEEIFYFIQKNYLKLKLSPCVEITEKIKAKNFKRLQREAKKYKDVSNVSTKSQEAVKLLLEENKKERRIRKKEKQDKNKKYQFELKQLKKKQKHRGK